MKYFYLIIGCVSTALGIIGAVLPILPTVPFLLLAMFCFSRSSDRLKQKLEASSLYQKYIVKPKTGGGMDKATKIKAMVTVTLLMSIGFIMMHQIIIVQILLLIIWSLHVYFIIFRIKTTEKKQEI